MPSHLNAIVNNFANFHASFSKELYRGEYRQGHLVTLLRIERSVKSVGRLPRSQAAKFSRMINVIAELVATSLRNMAFDPYVDAEQLAWVNADGLYEVTTRIDKMALALNTN